MPSIEHADLLAAALERIGDRWSLLAIGALLDGPRRFGELQQAMAGVATNVLSARLRQLERQGLVVTEPYSTRPLRLEYRATARAEELAGALQQLAIWGAGVAGETEPPSHAVCGSTLELRYWCPTCQQPVEEDDELWV